MKTTAKGQSVLREVIVYILWLALGIAISIFSVFLGASLIFHTKKIPSEAAALAFLPPTLIVTYLRLRKTGKSFSDLGLGIHATSFIHLILGFIAGACFMSIAFVVLKATQTITIQLQAINATLLATLFISFVSILFQSGTEELVFRGYLLNTIASKGKVLSILVTAALFALSHFLQGVNPVGWLNIFLFGILAAQLFFLKRNLWMPIGLHLGWNYFQTQVFGFPLYGSSNSGILKSITSTANALSGGSYGPEGSMVITALLLLAIGITSRFDKN